MGLPRYLVTRWKLSVVLQAPDPLRRQGSCSGCRPGSRQAVPQLLLQRGYCQARKSTQAAKGAASARFPPNGVCLRFGLSMQSTMHDVAAGYSSACSAMTQRPGRALGARRAERGFPCCCGPGRPPPPCRPSHGRACVRARRRGHEQQGRRRGEQRRMAAS